MRRLIAGLLLLAATATAARDRPQELAVRESLRSVHPRLRSRWLAERGLSTDDFMPARLPDSGSGLRLVGKWGGGPSWAVTGRDSLVFLSRGSEVVVLSFADPQSPRILGHIQADGLVSRSVLVGDRLYVGSTGWPARYVEVFDVTDPADAHRLGQVQTMLNDIAVVDTLVYTIADDSFKVWNFADPPHPALLGACRDSGYSIAVNSGHAYLGDRWGLYVIDVTNPSSPHRVGSWGGQTFSVTARGTICCLTAGNPGQPGVLDFYILSTANPASPQQLGHLDDAGGYDIFLDDTLAFLSGYYAGGHEFRILSIADSAHPRHIGTAATPDIGNSGVWADRSRNRAYVADRLRGMSVFDISDLSLPVRDTGLLAAGSAEDVAIDRGLAYVAGDGFGMTILDLAAPSAPVELGVVDSTRDMVTRSVIARDSFAYMGWAIPPYLKSIEVTDPAHPVKAGTCAIFDWPGDMVLRDTLLYVAQRIRFQVLNVARPRQPVLVGSCVTQGDAEGLCLRDTIAYMASYPAAIISVSDPANPRIIGTITRGVWNISVRDTFAFVSSGGVVVYSVANPAQPRVLDSLSVGPGTYWVEAVGELLYLGNRDGVRVVDAADVHNMRVRGFVATPYSVKRLTYASPYIYAACWDAGVVIIESTQVAVSEPAAAGGLDGGVRVAPNPAGRRATVRWSVASGSAVTIIVRDVTGREVLREVATGAPDGRFGVGLESLAPGVYFVDLSVRDRRESVKLSKR